MSSVKWDTAASTTAVKANAEFYVGEAIQKYLSDHQYQHKEAGTAEPKKKNETETHTQHHTHVKYAATKHATKHAADTKGE